jgi:guanine deaminase
MNRNCPKHYIEPSAQSSIADTREIIKHIHQLPSPSAYDSQRSLVHPILTPRFAISCTDDLLNSLGELAASDKDLRIQTHISENKDEITFTRELFPAQPSYAAVYDASGLLRRGTVLAHAVHLSDDELSLVAQRNAGISHCPTSNFNLRSGLAPVGEMLDRGINVGVSSF